MTHDTQICPYVWSKHVWFGNGSQYERKGNETTKKGDDDDRDDDDFGNGNGNSNERNAADGQRTSFFNKPPTELASASAGTPSCSATTNVK
mmetsp:Transcript_24987/g.68920  ORF Transcript_24987/g.68920 Transcript_24987/m.68920 type:complete len:91 (-) Transcript_24987:516-788(-)|eukprot:CAMPEP_0172379048 /NCGR_PEP_ID=MMETSP1060-20121228/69732_1 /TAXON_ID=37318 /ORGANISM="Pseudo-nitzschia pungens, Strain cf. cingulata" /LENGTH=90 /DNA_ID=CAMNT_0013106781 /DNA_START=104 /DNA_END=376 /DNA_ORIENTATION=-